MRLTTVFIIGCLMQVSAHGLAQKISLSKNNAPLKAILKEIKAQSGYNFVYRDELLDLAKPVNIKVTQVELSEVLEKVFSEQPLSYSVDNKTVIIKEKSFLDKASVILNSVQDLFREIDVRGRVVDEQDKPVPGATVRLKKGKGAAITNKDGEFVVKGADEDDVLIITYIGYSAKEVAVSANVGMVRLELATSKLDEVQVQAYGVTSRRLSTANITTITSKQIENKPVTNVLQALQGEVPGLVIIQSSGFANGGISVQLRGLNTLNGSGDPLYIIDGIPYDSQLPPTINGVGGLSKSRPGDDPTARSGNPLAFINPQDIESVSILKDADATSIYGSRAANGAILITTKKAKAGDSRVDLTVSQGVAYVPKFLDMMNTEQYLEMRKHAYFVNDGSTDDVNISPEYASQYDINGTWDQNRYTDWQRELLGGKASYGDYNLSLSGGGALSSYRIGGTYHRETNIFRQNDLNDQKASLAVALNHRSSNNRFAAQFSANYMYDLNKLPTRDLAGYANRLAPNAPALYNSDGSLNWALDANGTPSWENPLAEMLGTKAEIKTANLVSNMALNYELFEGLTLKTSAGYTRMDINDWQGFTQAFLAPPYRQGFKPIAVFNTANSQGWNIEPQLSYHAGIGKGVLDVLAGATMQGRSMNQLATDGTEYANEFQLRDPRSAGRVRISSSNQTEYRYAALFARAGYVYDGKYQVNLSARRDGSSRFGSNNLFHTFYSVAAGWNFSEESSIKENLPWLSFGKLRGSYGSTGSDNMGDYRFMNLYGVWGHESNYQGILALQTFAIPNPDLQWEETRKLDLGMELGFLKDRILLSGSYFRNRSSNQLIAYGLPILTGFGAVIRNLDATLQNSGLEFTLTTKNIQRKDLQWSTNLNIAMVRNKLLEFPNLGESSYNNRYLVGYSTSLRQIWEYAGLNPQTGLYQFYRPDGSITSDVDFDFTKFSDQFTRYSGGITNTFSYKGFGLSFLVNFARRNMQDLSAGLAAGLFNYNQPAVLTDYWKAPGDRTTYQRVSSRGDNLGNFFLTQDSDFAVRDIYYLRLNNVSISYTLPGTVLQKAGFQNAQVFCNAQNMGVITNFKGLDPESGASGLPPLRVITLGLRAAF